MYVIVWVLWVLLSHKQRVVTVKGIGGWCFNHYSNIGMELGHQYWLGFQSLVNQ